MEETLFSFIQKIKEEIEDHKDKQKPFLIAIDGMCASGKTVLADNLHKLLPSSGLFHMDDFFLTSGLRTPERLKETGGNVDYARFQEQVLTPLLAGHPISYQVYDCRLGRFAKTVKAEKTSVAVIEGAYSMHPSFGSPYSLTVFLTITEDEQKRRVLKRSREMYERFIGEWIPKENKYFSEMDIAKKADFLVDNTDFLYKIL